MEKRRAILALTVLFAGVFVVGLVASHRWQSWKYADPSIRWYNGGTGDYYNIYQEEAIADGDAWHPFTVVDLTQVGSSGTDDQINSFNGFYGSTGWLGIAEIQAWSGWTIIHGRTRLNQSYLDSGSYSRTNKSHVACQEVGHMFGLEHNRNEFDTCMNDTILTAPQPNAHDADMLVSIYGSGGPPPSDGPDILVPDEALFAGDEATSSDGRFHFVYQGDGNLVLYRWDWVALWASNTGGTSAGRAHMQSDGNFVIYDAGGTPVWNSGTAGNSGAYLIVQSDGNVVIYSSGGSALWSTGTCCY